MSIFVIPLGSARPIWQCAKTAVGVTRQQHQASKTVSPLLKLRLVTIEPAAISLEVVGQYMLNLVWLPPLAGCIFHKSIRLARLGLHISRHTREDVKNVSLGELVKAELSNSVPLTILCAGECLVHR